MYRLSIISIFFFFNCLLFANNMTDINYIRKEFNLAIENGKKADDLHAQLLKLKPASNTLQFAYLGATEALLAKHSFNPFSKLNYVNSALIKLNKAVELNVEDIEIRYMRFSVEANMPSYLGYSKHIVEDKHVLVKGLKNIGLTSSNCEMYKIFAKGIMNTSYCNKEEKILLSTLIDVCNQKKQNNN